MGSREERRIERRRWRKGGKEGGKRDARERGLAGARTRKGQFDVNGSIVIRVNRLPYCSSTVCRTQSMIFVLLYFIPRGIKVVEKSGPDVATNCECLSRGTKPDLCVTDDGKRETWVLQGDEIDVFVSISILMHSELEMRPSSSYNRG